MTRLDYGSTQITVFIYGLVRRGRLVTDVVKSIISSCDCSLNDDIEIALISPWPTAPSLLTTAEQVDPDATLSKF